LQYIFLSHDVDWPRKGPSNDHIYARKDRFDGETLMKVGIENPYYNIPNYIALEEKFGVKSTFFFRTMYENGSYEEYEDDIRELIQGDWEIGLHLDPISTNDTWRIYEEKTNLERIVGMKIQGNRCHNLAFNNELPAKLHDLGFMYDSSVRYSKDRIDDRELGFKIYHDIIEFPVTIMDAYLFTYMKIKEEQLVGLFEDTLNYSRSLNNSFNIITVIWHDNVLQMKGGRMFSKILECLTCQNDTVICRGMDIAGMIKNKIMVSQPA
jgi:peptidoglycan/xylan/chitin deacetylase (PgdA/CDA1 family)